MFFPTLDRTDIMVVDVGPPADWVKINVRTTVSLSVVFLFSES